MVKCTDTSLDISDEETVSKVIPPKSGPFEGGTETLIGSVVRGQAEGT